MGAPSRLQLFRAEWPKHVAWGAVREESPEAFRSFRNGALLALLAAAVTALACAFFFEIPFAVPLPHWLEWARGLLMVVTLFAAILLWIFAIILMSMPADARRGIAHRTFAQARGLSYASYGFDPERIGVWFAEDENAPPTLPARLRDRPDPSRAPLFRSRFAIYSPGESRRGHSLQLGIAQYSGNKSDPKGPQHTFRFLETTLPRRLPHLMLDARRGGTLGGVLPSTQKLSLEGDFDRYFTA